MIFVEDEGKVEGEGGDRSESKVAWALARACLGTSTWGSSDRATSPRRLSEQGFCQMQFPVQLTRGRPSDSRLVEIGCVGMCRFSRAEETSQMTKWDKSSKLSKIQVQMLLARTK